jgi:hypothetical protein
MLQCLYFTETLKMIQTAVDISLSNLTVPTYTRNAKMEYCLCKFHLRYCQLK